MFGKPQWFRPKRFGWGLTPITWQGWVYALVAAGLLALPFVFLVSRGQAIEAVIWLSAGIAVLVWDAKQILTALGHTGGCCRRTPAPPAEPPAE